MNKGITILIDSSGSMDGEPLCRAHQMVCDIIFAYHNLMQKSLWVCKDWIHMILYNSNLNELFLLSDSNRIKQIIRNLMSNAIKFTDNGIIKIILDLAKIQ